MKKHSFIKIASVLMTLVLTFAIVPTASPAIINVAADSETDNIYIHSPLNDFIYHIENERAIIYEYVGTDKEVIIPHYINDCPVREISVSAFEGNDYIESVKIPKTLATIGARAFADCQNLSKISIPNPATTISGNAFAGTAYYNNLDNWENGVLYTGTHLLACNKNFEGVCVLKAGTSHIAPNAFENCKKLTAIILSKELLSIGAYAFKGCENLKTVGTHPNVTNIGESCFTGCNESIRFFGMTDENGLFETYCNNRGYSFYGSELLADYNLYYTLIDNKAVITGGKDTEKLTIPNKIDGKEVTEIIDGAFKGNKTLEQVTVRYGIERIGESAFEDCTSLYSIELQGSSSVGRNAIKNTAFYNNEKKWKNGLLVVSGIYVLDAKEDISGVVRVPYAIRIIGDSAFSDCKNIEGIYLYDELFYIIGDYAFENCENLKGVKIPTTLETMGRDIFKGSENAEVYAVEETDLIKELCKSESIPLNIIGKYSVYDEEWDITMYAYDDVKFTVEEITYTEEELKNLKDSLKGINIVGKAYKVNIYDPFGNYDLSEYINTTLKIPFTGETVVEIYKNTNESGDYLYKAYPFYVNEIKDGYAEIDYSGDDVIANVNFDYYSTTDEAETLSLSLPVPAKIASLRHYIRNEENDEDFEHDIDKNIPQGKSFSYVNIKPEYSDYLPYFPSNIGIKVQIPTEYEENVAYVYNVSNSSFSPIECETKNGFAEFTYPFGSIYYYGCAVAGIEEIEITTEPIEPTEPAKPTEPVETTPTKPSTFDEPVTTDPVKNTDPTENTTEATEPTESTAETTEAVTTPDKSETPTAPTTPDEEELLLGDVNRDGKLNIRDATLIQKHLAKLASLDDEQMIIADITLDKKVNIKDATTIQKKIANLI